MPFSEKCLKLKGDTVRVNPIYAYGWSHSPATEEKTDNQPKPFTIRINDFLRWQNQWVAMQGTVERPGHDFDGFWITAVPRIDDKLIDFDSSIGPWGIIISPDRTTLDASKVPPNHPEAVQTRSQPLCRGHVELSSTHQPYHLRSK